MGYLVEIIKALAWPVSIIWLGYLFRSEVRMLLGRLTVLKHGETEISFSKNLEKAEEKAFQINDINDVDFRGDTPEDINQRDLLYKIAEISPRAAIVEAWTLIETAAVKSNLVMGSTFKRTSAKLIQDNLINTGKFGKDSIELINELRQLRNKASHLPDFAISQSEAERYLDLAIKSAHAIENLASK